MSSSRATDVEFFTLEHVNELQDSVGASKYFIEGKVKVPKDQLVLYFRNPVSKEVQWVGPLSFPLAWTLPIFCNTVLTINQTFEIVQSISPRPLPQTCLPCSRLALRLHLEGVTKMSWIHRTEKHLSSMPRTLQSISLLRGWVSSMRLQPNWEARFLKTAQTQSLSTQSCTNWIATLKGISSKHTKTHQGMTTCWGAW